MFDTCSCREVVFAHAGVMLWRSWAGCGTDTAGGGVTDAATEVSGDVLGTDGTETIGPTDTDDGGATVDDQGGGDGASDEEFCNAGGECENRRADGLACTLDAQRLTHRCGLGPCGDGACP